MSVTKKDDLFLLRGSCRTATAGKPAPHLMFAAFLFSIGLCLSASRTAQAIPLDDPFAYFNVYSLGNINYSHSDFEGKAGAAGNVSFDHFDLAKKDNGGYSLLAGGNVTFTNGTFHGGVDAGKNISVGGILIDGDVHSGGSVSNNSAGGTIKGNVYAAGSTNLDQHITYFSKHSGVAYVPEADLPGISKYFKDFSAEVGAWSNTGTIGSAWGTLSISANSGTNVFSLSAADMYAASTVKITGVKGSVVYINVMGANANLNSTTWKFFGGITADDVLLNYVNAATLSMTSANNVNILAPLADTIFHQGVVTGNLIVGNLTGSGQVNLGHFADAPTISELRGNISPIPEPATILLMCMGLIGMRFISGRTFPSPRGAATPVNYKL